MNFSSIFRRRTAFLFLFLIVQQALLPTAAMALTGGPSQPEFASFSPAGMSEMVDAFSGDFSYDIPLFDIGGYPMNLSYKSGSNYEDEASWVGLGWTLNPGAINRNTRGIPDDFNGDIIKTETYRKDQIGFTGTVSPQGEFFGLGIGKKKLSPNFGLAYDSYKGLGTVIGLSKSEGLGPFSASITSNSLSGFSFSTSLSTTIKSANEMSTQLGLTGSYNSRAGLQYIGYQVTKSKEQHFCSKHDGANDFTYSTGVTLASGGFSYQPTSFGGSTYNLTSKSVNFSTTFGITLAVADGRLSLNGNYNISKLAENIRNQPAYGFLNSKIAKDIANSNSIYDYSKHNDGMVLPERPDVPYSLGDYDVFYISGQGISGQFQAETRSSGQSLNPHTESSSVSITAGLEFSPGAEWYIGIDAKGGGGSNTTGNLGVSSNISSLFEHKSNAIGSISEEIKWNLSTDFQLNEQELMDNYGSQAPVAFTWSGSGRDIELNKKMNKRNVQSAINIPLNSSGSTSPAIGAFERRPRKNVLSSLLAIEAATVGFDKLVRSYKKDIAPYQIIQSNNINSYKEINRTTITKSHHLSEFKVTQPSGMRYVYGLPVSSGDQYDITMSVDGPIGEGNYFGPLISYSSEDASSNNSKGVDHFFEKKMTPASTNSFLLTSVQSPDYVDKTNNGLSSDDLGQAIKFNYTLLTDGFKWRNPVAPNKAALHRGNLSNPQDDKASYSYGAKSVWYLHSMESNDYIAVFHTSDRNDCLQIDKNGDKLPTEKRMQKLDKISIYSKANLLLDSINAKPIKEIHFSYSYKLGSKLPNSIDDLVGKLTLDKVWTTFSDNDTKFAVNSFEYNLPFPSYKTDLSDRWGSYARQLDGIARVNFPYTAQNKSDTNTDASIFNIKKIIQPTGATIDVFYEADDYQFVQDKRASAMYKIHGFYHDLDPLNNVIGNADVNARQLLYGDNSKQNKFIVAKLLEPLSVSEVEQSNYVTDKFFPDYDLNLPIFFKVKCRMKRSVISGVDDAFEYLQGYVDLDKSFVPKLLKNNINDTEYQYVAFKINHVEETGENIDNSNWYHPISFIGFQKIRLELPYLIYPTPQYLGQVSNDGAILDFIKSVVQSTFQDISQMVMGYALNCRQRNFCDRVNLNESFIRLGVPKAKIGGGSRVNKVVMKDHWKQGQVLDADGTLTRKYHYELEDGTSSGVATWEPTMGRDENSHVSVMPYTQAVKMAPDNTFYSEKPFCESLMPSPSVGYSRVIVVDEDIIGNSNGWNESKFYTAKDYPTEVFATQPEKKHYWPKILNWIPVYNQNVNHLHLSQGFTVINNAFHGKPKSQITYKGKFNGASTKLEGENILQSKQYEYRMGNSSLSGLTKYRNDIPMLTKNLQIETKSVLNKMHIWQNFYIDNTKNNIDGIEFNTDIVTYFFGIPIPLPWPSYQISDIELQLSSTVKQFEVTPILSAVTINDKGSTLRTENVLWDSETGDVLMTRTQNEFNNGGNNDVNWTYNLSLPAHYVYDQMGGGYQNIGYSETINQDANGRFSSQHLVPGDEVSILNTDGEAVSKLLTVVAFDDGVTNRLALMDEKGKVFKNSPFSVKVIRSGYKNLLDSKVYEVVLEKNPIVNGKLELKQTSWILNAGAITYSDQWQIFKSIRKDSCASVVHNILVAG